jgi:hypothetical protein
MKVLDNTQGKVSKAAANMYTSISPKKQYTKLPNQLKTEVKQLLTLGKADDIDEKKSGNISIKPIQAKSSCASEGNCGCAACSAKKSTDSREAFSINTIQAFPAFQFKCKTCGADSHSTAKCPKTKKEEKKEGQEDFRIVSRNGCFNDKRCTNYISGADFCHNCKGTHVSWTYSLGDKQSTFCFPCSFLGKDEKTAKHRMETSARESMGEAIKV